jgi:hypothetical protein
MYVCAHNSRVHACKHCGHALFSLLSGQLKLVRRGDTCAVLLFPRHPPALLAVKQAKWATLDAQEGECMSRLAALDMARRRFTMDSRPGQSSATRLNSVSARARAASGAYGFAALAKSFRGATPLPSDDSDSDDAGGSAGGDGGSLPSVGEGSAEPTTRGSPTGGKQSGSNGSPNKREILRRRLSTTTSFTRPSEIPGNRAIRLVRKVMISLALSALLEATSSPSRLAPVAVPGLRCQHAPTRRSRNIMSRPSLTTNHHHQLSQATLPTASD